MKRRLLLHAFGGVLGTHVVGCGASRARSVAQPTPPPAPVPAAPDPSFVPTSTEAATEAVPAIEEAAVTVDATPRELALPARSANAETGSRFLDRCEGLGRAAMDEAVFEAIMAGNVPSFLRPWKELPILGPSGERAVLWVTCDYLAVGSDTDFIRMPMTASAAQRIADIALATLPTRHIVDLIYAASTARLPPSYIDGGPTEGTLEDYAVHHEKLETRRVKRGHALGALMAGHKKDIVLSNRLLEKDDRVAIYGWHKAEGDVIQSLSITHSRRYADYSHGVRLVAQAMTIEGKPHRTSDVLIDPDYAELLSDEGPLEVAKYPTTLPEYTASSSSKKKSKKT